MEREMMNKIIYFFAHKYKYNWDDIYDAIKLKEPVEKEKVIKEIKEQYLTIVDEDYPNNFKDVYMPPLILFYKGNRQLIHCDDEIVSLWLKDDNLDCFAKANLDKAKVYALIVTKQNIDAINVLINEGYKLILIGEILKQSITDILINENVLVISEISFNSNKFSEAKEQTLDRILLGVSKKCLVLQKSIAFLNKIHALFEFEHRSISVLDLKDYSDEEIKKFNLINYN